ncbi:MAG: response regulator [Anaerolineales bacterium]|nr:response regulator [Anaerolineales bacterium]
MTKPLALIIEDEEMLATIFEQALSMAEYETEVVRDGREAMTRLDNDPVPNVITLDLHLPFVSGEDILDHIRASERLAKTKVIIATADARMGDFLDKKADLVLIKPIRFSQLRDLASRLNPNR